MSFETSVSTTQNIVDVNVNVYNLVCRWTSACCSKATAGPFMWLYRARSAKLINGFRHVAHLKSCHDD
eukprot:jgi/Botrbrau1/10884/Bobra.0025s0061.1